MNSTRSGIVDWGNFVDAILETVTLWELTRTWHRQCCDELTAPATPARRPPSPCAVSDCGMVEDVAQ
jgi:hypothetical protein